LPGACRALERHEGFEDCRLDERDCSLDFVNRESAKLECVPAVLVIGYEKLIVDAKLERDSELFCIPKVGGFDCSFSA